MNFRFSDPAPGPPVTDVPVLVVVPFYNAQDWIVRCMDSIAAQTYRAMRVLLVDDASTDRSRDIVARGYWPGMDGRYLGNQSNLKMPHSLYDALRVVSGDPDEVIVLVDGDDFLPDPDSIAIIASYYDWDPNLWLTWGSYTRWPDPTVMPNPAQPYPAAVAAANGYRYHGYEAFNHPLTFRRHLWDRLTERDLRDDDGHWWTVGYDKVIMFPMLELSGPQHQRFLPEVLYVYNEGNPASEHKTVPPGVGDIQPILAKRKPYDPIE